MGGNTAKRTPSAASRLVAMRWKCLSPVIDEIILTDRCRAYGICASNRRRMAWRRWVPGAGGADGTSVWKALLYLWIGKRKVRCQKNGYVFIHDGAVLALSQNIERAYRRVPCNAWWYARKGYYQAGEPGGDWVQPGPQYGMAGTDLVFSVPLLMEAFTRQMRTAPA